MKLSHIECEKDILIMVFILVESPWFFSPPNTLLSGSLWTSKYYAPSFPFSSVAPAPMNERQLQLKERDCAQQPILGTIEFIVCSQHCGAKSHFIAQCVLGIPLHQYNRPSLKLSYFPYSLLSWAAPHSPAAGNYNPLPSKAPLSLFARDHKASAAILNSINDTNQARSAKAVNVMACLRFNPFEGLNLELRNGLQLKLYLMGFSST